MLLKTRFVLFLGLLICLSLITYHLSLPNVFAQVMSGNVQIKDIVIDEGGGKVTSGAVTLANTSIGQEFGGSFVNSGNQIVCAGHTCKIDYNYDPGAQPTTQAFIINAGTDAVAAGAYGMSGLKDNQEGGNYYNSISVQPSFTGYAPDFELAGAAFTENQNNIASAVSLDPFQDVLSSANTSKGFVVIYAHKNKKLTGGPVANNGPSGCGLNFNFCANSYYVYIDGNWRGPFATTSNWRVESSNNDRLVRASDYRTNTTINNPPTKLAFNAQFNQALGNKTWGTYGFAITSTPIAGSFSNVTPVPSLPSIGPTQAYPTSVSANATFYMFELF